MMNDPALWWSSLNPNQAALELLMFGACIALALLIVMALRRVTLQWELSVLLGRKLIDGVLFPVLLLGLVFATDAYSVYVFLGWRLYQEKIITNGFENEWRSSALRFGFASDVVSVCHSYSHVLGWGMLKTQNVKIDYKTLLFFLGSCHLWQSTSHF
jgi:hypothetical protein